MCPFNDAIKAFGISSESNMKTKTANDEIHMKPPAKPFAFSVVFGTLVYCYMFVVFVFTYLLTFIAPKNVGSYLGPFTVFEYNVDQDPNDVGTAQGVATNVGLMLIFAFFHSLLARNSIKKVMKIPNTIERSFFVLQAAILVHFQMHFWKGFEYPLLWSIHGKAEYVLIALQLVGILFLLTATFALDHFHLFGLAQAYGVDINKFVGLSTGKDAEGELSVRFHYALVAHPLMTGILIALWAVPRMTGSRFLLAAISTTYILLSVKYLEEPQIKDMMGDEYTDYLRRVPRYIPFMKPAIASDDNDIEPEYAIDMITGHKTKAL